mmetsp:Transcript_30624/g.76700  ORF Transcript_30624/g.76700 Transcript_30624/m.76700 type:complete len:269 (-) Transcript_30624:533-1339(-)
MSPTAAAEAAAALAAAAAAAAPSGAAMGASREACATALASCMARPNTSASIASPKSVMSGSHSSLSNMGAAAPEGGWNPSTRHWRRRSSAARVPAPDTCATPRSESVAAAVAAAAPSTPLPSPLPLLSPLLSSSPPTPSMSMPCAAAPLSAASAAACSALVSASISATTRARAAAFASFHARSSPPSRGTLCDTATCSGSRAPGGRRDRSRTSRARLPGCVRSVSTTRLRGSDAHCVKRCRDGPASNDPNDASTTLGPGRNACSSSVE